MTNTANKAESELTRPCSRIFAVTCVLFFVVLMLLPTVRWMSNSTDYRQAALKEGRVLAERPAWPTNWSEWLLFPRELEKYLGDHLGFRTELLSTHNVIKTEIGISPTSSLIVGDNNWLFYGASLELVDVRGISRLNPVQTQKWLRHLNRVHDELQAKGVKFLFVIAPDKSTIYSEYLPDNFDPDAKARANELLEWLRVKNCRAKVLDLRPALFSAKQSHQVYFKYDTHWNDFGAAIGVNEIVKELRSIDVDIDVPEFKFSDFRLEDHIGGDLAILTRQSYVFEQVPVFVKSLQTEYEIIENSSELAPLSSVLGGDSGNLFLSTASKEPDPDKNYLIFHDSFFNNAVPYFSAFVSRCDYVRLQPNTTQILKTVEAVEPDVVIVQVVERYLSRVPQDSNYNDIESPFDLLPYLAYSWILNPVSMDDVKVSGNVKLVNTSSTGFEIMVDGPKVQVKVRNLPLSTEGVKVLKLRIKMPADTRFRVFTKLPDEDKFDRDSKIIQDLRAGWNDVEVVLSSSKLDDELLIDPGDALGNYELANLELRTEKRPIYAGQTRKSY